VMRLEWLAESLCRDPYGPTKDFVSNPDCLRNAPSIQRASGESGHEAARGQSFVRIGQTDKWLSRFDGPILCFLVPYYS
jgi:hypothetical protein